MDGNTTSLTLSSLTMPGDNAIPGLCFSICTMTAHSNLDSNLTAFTYRLIVVDSVTRFLSFVVPYADGLQASGLSAQIRTCIAIKGEFVISIGQLTVTFYPVEIGRLHATLRAKQDLAIHRQHCFFQSSPSGDQFTLRRDSQCFF